MAQRFGSGDRRWFSLGRARRRARQRRALRVLAPDTRWLGAGVPVGHAVRQRRGLVRDRLARRPRCRRRPAASRRRCARVLDGRRARRLHDFSSFSLETLELARGGGSARRPQHLARSRSASSGRGSDSDRGPAQPLSAAVFVCRSHGLPVNFAAERCRSGRTGLTRNQVCE